LKIENFCSIARVFTATLDRIKVLISFKRKKKVLKDNKILKMFLGELFLLTLIKKAN